MALHRPDVPKPRAIVLELCGLAPGRDELEALARTGIPIILLGGAVELPAERVSELEWAAVIRRPFTVGAVAGVVDELAGG